MNQQSRASRRDALMWVNHLALLPGDSSVTTSYDAVSSGVGGGLSGLVLQSSQLGENGASGGNKVVWRALDIPPDFQRVTGVRLCYELSNPRTYISQIRLAQVQDPPSTALVLLDDGTDLKTKGPICVDSAKSDIDPSNGALLLSLRIFTGDVSDKIVIRALGLHVRL